MKECSINGCDCRIKKIQNNLDKPRSMIHDFYPISCIYAKENTHIIFSNYAIFLISTDC